jgi:hypothetical protein
MQADCFIDDNSSFPIPYASIFNDQEHVIVDLIQSLSHNSDSDHNMGDPVIPPSQLPASRQPHQSNGTITPIAPLQTSHAMGNHIAHSTTKLPVFNVYTDDHQLIVYQLFDENGAPITPPSLHMDIDQDNDQENCDSVDLTVLEDSSNSDISQIQRSNKIITPIALSQTSQAMDNVRYDS